MKAKIVEEGMNMKKLLQRTLSILLTSVIVLGVIGVANVKKVGAATATEAFVTRLYRVSLGRAPDQSGLNYWVNGLDNGSISGSKAVENFVLSEEMFNKYNRNSDWVDAAYEAIMNREADGEGWRYWTNKMNEEGRTRAWVTAQLINSQEFTNLCAAYGITRGSSSYSEANDNIASFVTRMYDKVLGRGTDPGGLDFWVNELKNGMSPWKFAESIVFSHEFNMSGVSEQDYVRTLYRAFMGREPAQSEVNYWHGLRADINNMNWRYNTFVDFVNSSEFKGIVASMGLNSNYTVQHIHWNTPHLATIEAEIILKFKNNSIAVVDTSYIGVIYSQYTDFPVSNNYIIVNAYDPSSTVYVDVRVEQVFNTSLNRNRIIVYIDGTTKYYYEEYLKTKQVY